MKRPSINSYFKTYFTFSKSERNGILVLFIIIAAILLAIYFIPKAIPEKTSKDFQSFQSEIDSLFAKDLHPDSAKQPRRRNSFSDKGHPRQIVKVELNSCDSASLTTLPGIGPVFASRILKYKNLLGGFNEIDQLSEVFGFKKEYFSKAIPYLYINRALIARINIDSVTFRSLSQHPYIGKEKAKQILFLRSMLKGTSVSYEQLAKSNIFDSIQWYRIKPYLILGKSASE